MSYNTTPSESTVRAVRSARTVSKTVTVREPVTTYVERQVEQPTVEPTVILTLHLTELDARLLKTLTGQIGGSVKDPADWQSCPEGTLRNVTDQIFWRLCELGVDSKGVSVRDILEINGNGLSVKPCPRTLREGL